jgi:hypothetical protein
MKIKNDLVDRFLSDTPDLFKRLDLLGLLIVAIAGFLADNGYSGKLVTVAGAVGGVICLISKFVKKDMQLLQSTTDDLQAINDHLPELKEQAQAVIKTLKPALDELNNENPKE